MVTNQCCQLQESLFCPEIQWQNGVKRLPCFMSSTVKGNTEKSSLDERGNGTGKRNSTAAIFWDKHIRVCRQCSGIAPNTVATNAQSQSCCRCGVAEWPRSGDILRGVLCTHLRSKWDGTTKTEVGRGICMLFRDPLGRELPRHAKLAKTKVGQNKPRWLCGTRQIRTTLKHSSNGLLCYFFLSTAKWVIAFQIK